MSSIQKITIPSIFRDTENFYKGTRVSSQYHRNTPHIALEKMALELNWEEFIILLEDLPQYRNQIGQNLMESYMTAIDYFPNLPMIPDSYIEKVKEIKKKYY